MDLPQQSAAASTRLRKEQKLLRWGKWVWKSDKSTKRCLKICLSRPVDSYKWVLVAHANGYGTMKHYDGVMFGKDREFYFTCRTYFIVYEDIGNPLSVFFSLVHSLHYLLYNVFRHILYFFSVCSKLSYSSSCA